MYSQYVNIMESQTIFFLLYSDALSEYSRIIRTHFYLIRMFASRFEFLTIG